MGYGDEIIASGLARGFYARGKLAAFGTANKIIWSEQSKQIFLNNPNVAKPEFEKLPNLEWIPHYRGNRLYGEVRNGRWVFKEFNCPRGDIYLTAVEKHFGKENTNFSDPIVVIEPRVKLLGACAGSNKQWPIERYKIVADELTRKGMKVIQLVPPKNSPLLNGVEVVETPTFRFAMAVLSNSSLYIGPEGGLHHAAAAFGIPAVVIFGGFNSPKSTGYKDHENIAIGEPCGNIAVCAHCKAAMKSISVDQVISSTRRFIQ